MTIKGRACACPRYVTLESKLGTVQTLPVTCQELCESANPEQDKKISLERRGHFQQLLSIDIEHCSVLFCQLNIVRRSDIDSAASPRFCL
jgi:hypothetical protein